VWQRDESGKWRPIEASITPWVESNRALPFHHPDSTGIACQESDSRSGQLFRTRVIVASDSGRVAESISSEVNLDRDCLERSGVRSQEGFDNDRVGAIEAAADGMPTCPVKVSKPDYRKQKDSIRAKTRFDCVEVGPFDVRYLRVRLVEDTPGPIDKVIVNRAFADESGLARSFNLIAECRVASDKKTTYYNSSREVYEWDRGQNEGTVDSVSVDLKARCK
jgi:hypothetical protein